MSDPILTTQAALLYRATPALDFDALLERLNQGLSAFGSPPLEDSPMSSDQFCLFRNAKLHASVAVHRTPLPARGLQHALAATASRSKRTDFGRVLNHARAHVIVTVGDGPTPAPMEPAQPAPTPLKLAVLHRLISLVHAQDPAAAAHVCTTDLFHAPEELEIATTQTIVPGLVMHPLAADEPARALRFCNSEHLIGKTLELQDIPASIPLSMQMAVGNTLVTQHLAGSLPLEDGDTLDDSLGVALTVRHSRPTAQAPTGRIIAAFATKAQRRAPRWDNASFHNHPGYMVPATPPAPAKPVKAEPEEWIPPEPAYGSRIAASSSGKSSNWIIWVGIGLFLWIGLPLLKVPQMVLEAAFSEDLVDTPLAGKQTKQP